MDPAPDRPPPVRPAAAQPAGVLIVSWLRWFGIGRLIATAAAVLTVAAGGFWLLRSPPSSVESSMPFASSASSASSTSNVPVGPTGSPGPEVAQPPEGAIATTSSEPAGEIIVYVTGAVAAPGVHTLPRDARVHEAVAAAGGMTSDADADAVNLAGFLVDGSRIYVPHIGVPVPSVVTPTGGGAGGGDPSPGGGGGSVAEPTGPVDLNTATAEMLDELPGVGPSTAAAIVAHRESSGPFASVDDLLDVRGIGPAKLDAIRELITV